MDRASNLIFLSELIPMLQTYLREFGDLPCVLENDGPNDQILFDPLVSANVVEIWEEGADHVENCIIFMSRMVGETGEEES